MNEYRRAKRRKVGDIDVIDTMTGQSVGKLSNLSETGMLLILGQPIISDALFQLRFTLTSENGRSRNVDVGAHALWSDDAAAPGQVWTGFRFITVPQEQMLELRNWIDAPGGQFE